MEFTFRWYGPDDPVPARHIRQIPGVTTVVTALHDVPPDEAWTAEQVRARQELLAKDGLRWSVVESVPVHESIKLGADDRDRHIETYAKSLKVLGAAGIRTVCYNFMPVFDWLRTEFAMDLPDGSNTMSYVHADLAKYRFEEGMPRLPAWAKGYSGPELMELAERYASIDAAQYLEHYRYFIEGVIPAAEAADVRLVIHPDDPPWSIFGLPRIINSAETLAAALAVSDSPYHGLTFCSGSLGARRENDLVAMVRAFGSRIGFVHLRNVKYTGELDFYESAHPQDAGDVDLVAIMAALDEVGFDGPVRPDHGRMIWGETGTQGYGLYDRALGLMYLRGAHDRQRLGRST